MNIDNNLRHLLENETKIHLAEIRFLYQKLDRQLGLNGARVPITFGFDTDRLGAYTPGFGQDEEEFHFSLLFIGYCVTKPLSKDDRMDLYKHEYAHYMQYNMDIPDKYNWQPGIHGSAWKYCCSLIGAAPTPYYKAGEGLIKHDYDKVLKKKITDKSIPIRDTYSREQEYRKKKNSTVKFNINDDVNHPKFGKGTIEHIEQLEGSVRLHVRFGEDLKKIDQKWLLQAGMKRQVHQGTYSVMLSYITLFQVREKSLLSHSRKLCFLLNIISPFLLFYNIFSVVPMIFHCNILPSTLLYSVFLEWHK